MMPPSIDTIPAGAQRVLLRADYNVPVTDGVIQDDYRIRSTIPTITALFDQGIQQILITSHRGRPDGADPELSTAVIANYLSERLDRSVTHCPTPVPHEDDIPRAEEAQVVVLENIRYEAGETEDSDELGQRLAGLADAYVNDAFGATHRKHSSTHAVQRHIDTYAGPTVLSEKRVAEEIRGFDGDRLLLLGGAKLRTKLGVITALASPTTTVSIAGAMMLPFFKDEGWSTGKTTVEEEDVVTASKAANHVSINLPVDVRVADSYDADQAETVRADHIPRDAYALDVADQTVQNILDTASTMDLVVWNGPLGYYENPVFAKATEDVLNGLRDLDTTVVIGGGDTAVAVNKHGFTEDFYHVSTGGGAFLSLIETGEIAVFND